MERKDNRLEAIRRGIDLVDSEISKLLEKRFDLVRDIFEVKNEMGLGITDLSRERDVLERIRAGIARKEYEESILGVFEYILKSSREFQGRMKGVPAAGCTAGKLGLVGGKLSHSLSPQIHGLFFERCGIKGSYDLIETPEEVLPHIVERMISFGYNGFNVTVPYKSEIMKHLDALSPEAARIGAVNTVLLSDGSKGYNTDYDGFGLSLEASGVDPAGRRFAVLGSGGAAHAVIAYLEDHNAAEITVVTRDAEAALYKFPGLLACNIADFRAKGYDAVINTTPVGMHGGIPGSPLTPEQLEGAGFVMDLIFNPAQTRLLKHASSLGIRSSNGLYMLVAQAVYSEEIWTGIKADRELIESIYGEIRKCF